MSLIFNAGFIVAIIYGAFLMKQAFISTGDLFGFLVILQYIYEPFPRFLQFSVYAQESKPVIERINEICSKSNKPLPSITPPSIRPIQSVRINLDEFAYKTDASPLLKNISCNIAPGECLGINGKSGIGKTTLVNILLGLHKTNAVFIMLVIGPISCTFDQILKK